MLLRAEGLGRTFELPSGPVPVLRGVDLELPEGGYLSITGPSGSGKSTLLHLLGCLDTPTEGRLWLRGRDVSGLDDRERSRVRARDVGLVFQSFHLIPELSVRENVEVPLVYARWDRARAHRRALEVLERVELGHRVDHPPGKLSGGEMQRVAIARALAPDPAVLLADEPHREPGPGDGGRDRPAGRRPAGPGTGGRPGHPRSRARRPGVPDPGPPGRPAPRARRRGFPVSGVLVTLLRIGLADLRAHRFRAALGASGLVVGVAAVVALSAVSEGGRRRVLAEVEALGTDTVIVHAARAGAPGTGPPAAPREVDRRDLERALGDRVRLSVARIVPVRMRAGSRETLATLVGTDAGAAESRGLRLGRGRFLSVEDGWSSRRVCVLGASVAEDLLGSRPAPGPEVWIEGVRFSVVGILEGGASPVAAEGGGYRPPDPSRLVAVPLETVRGLGSAALPEGWYSEIRLRGPGARPEEIRALAERVDAVLARHHPPRARPAVLVPSDLIERAARARRTLDLALIAIAGLGLLAGGTGIVNVMLATVSERRREIGIRRAVGASRADIAIQFLAQSAILAAAGGIAGTLVGAALAGALARLGGWPAVVDPGSVGVALLVATATGVGFGLVPALRAAGLDPIEALR